MNDDLMRRFPAVSYLEQHARKRIPHFGWEYLASGTTLDEGLDRNRHALSEVLLTPELTMSFNSFVNVPLIGSKIAKPI